MRQLMYYFSVTENSAHSMTDVERLSGEQKTYTPAGSALGLDWTADLELKGAHDKVLLILPLSMFWRKILIFL